jgi:folate-dependent phosphoribosylglycinamide formyltransferase PurN
VPAEFFDKFQGKIYNGHPALITKYPELKGFNKQEDIASNQEKYPVCGSVIHEVIPELDSGDVVAAIETENTAKTIDEAYNLLRGTSLQSWKFFFTYIWEFE